MHSNLLQRRHRLCLHRLDGTGRLRDWDIFNRPAKGSFNGFSHFGIKAEADGKTVDARVVNSNALGSCMSAIAAEWSHNGHQIIICHGMVHAPKQHVHQKAPYPRQLSKNVYCKTTIRALYQSLVVAR